MIDQYSFHFEKGISDFQQKNYSSALRSFSKCIQLDPKSKSSYLNHGVICNIKQIHGVAYEDFTHVIHCDPWQLIAYYNRFISLMSMKKYEQALNDLNISLSLGYVKLGLIKNSISIVQKAINLVPNNVQAYLTKAILMARKQKFEEALVSLSTAIDKYPQYRLGLSERAAVYRKLNRHSQCEQDIKYLLELSHTQQISFTLIPITKKIQLKELIKQIQVKHAEFMKLRNQIFKGKQSYQKNIKQITETPQFQVFADIMNLPSLDTNSLIEGQLDKSKSYEKQNFKKEKLFKQMPKFIQINYSGTINCSDNTLKQIQNNKDQFKSFKTYHSKAEFESIHQQQQNTQRQIIQINQNGTNQNFQRADNYDPSPTSSNFSSNSDQVKQSVITKQNHFIELISQLGHRSGPLSRRSKIQYTDLQIEISGATLKRNTELIGSMSPYCEVGYGNQIKNTSIAYYSGKNPVWNHVVKFKVQDSRALITLKVFDKQFFKKDDLIGQAVITMYEQSHIFELKYGGNSIGNIFVKMKLI